MTANKYNRIKRQCKTARFPRTFSARMDEIPGELLASLTARQIAAIIDGPMESSYAASFADRVATI